jgi:hypothetical protein
VIEKANFQKDVKNANRLFDLLRVLHVCSGMESQNMS